ncbi:hypothetical protein ETB97_002755 [Aspergillus alliaceus]|uniref:Ubiquitin-like protease family profile domain-containing protein n=1 Tax=Petromyces alliaceus TaxID=209559 RepID=A0A8H6A473_PETAA|nr:hypothetical protein ETB97_002755 [Aspergillus burnettii]
MAGVFSTQRRRMEDATMRDVSMIDADDTRVGVEDQYYDPMDISPLHTSNEQSRNIAQPMDLTSKYPDYWVHCTPPKNGGVPRATRLDGKPMTRAPLIRPLARFSPKARIDPSTGRFKQQFIAQPLLRDNPSTFVSTTKVGSLLSSNKPNTPFSTNKHHSSNILSSLPYKPMTTENSAPTTRDSSFNSFLTTKSIWDRKTPSFTSNTSVTTAASFNSRKRSVDEGFNDECHNATPETDSPSNKYRRISVKGFPNSAVTSQDDTQRALANEATSNHSAHPIMGQPIVPTATAPILSDGHMQSKHTTTSVAFVSDSHFSTSGTVGDQINRATSTDTHIPGGWPEQSPAQDISSATAAVKFSLSPDEEPFMSGALVAPPAATVTVKSSNADDANVRSGQIPHMVRSFSEACHNLVQGASGTVKNVFTKAWYLVGQPMIDYVRRKPRLQTARRSPSSPRASPSRAAALRRLPEEQRRKIKDHKWRSQRGYATVRNLPFPELSLDILQRSTSWSPSMEEPGYSAAKSHASQFTKDAPNSANRLTKNVARYGAQTGITKPTGVQKSPRVTSMSPNLKRRLWPGRNRVRGNLELALQKGWKSGDFTELGVSTRIPLPNRAEREGRAVPKEGPKPKKQKKQVHFKEPLAQFIPEPTLPDLAPHLQPVSPNVDRTGLEKVSDEQKENVPPVSAVKEEVGVSEHVRYSWEEPIEYPLGRPVSAVSLFYPEAKPLPPGRTASVYAKEWKKIEEEEKQKQSPARVRLEGPAVRPLSKEWMSRVSSAMSAASNRTIATSVSGDPLTKKDLSTCFTPLAWLNDEVINSYLSLIVDYLRRTNHNNGRSDKPRFHAFNTFFFSTMRDKGYQSVRRWATRAKIGGASLLHVDTVFVPVHNSAHWTLIIIKPMERTIENFDSLGGPSPRHVAVMQDWLRNELGPRYVEEEWRVLPSVSPQQDNGSDCGVFLLSTAKAVAIGLEPLSYCARDIVLLRKKIVAELMAGGLEGDFDPASGGELLL